MLRVRHLLLPSALALPALLAGSCGGELPGPRVCSERAPCGSGKTCVLGRCRTDGTMPVSLRAERLHFEPEDVGFLAEDEAMAKADLGAAFALGRRDRREILLLRFALAFPEAARVQRAILVLEPFGECTRRPGRIAIELAQVLSPWRSSDVRHRKLPKLSVPMHAASSSATPPRPLRLDVTELVRQWREDPQRYHGLAVLASGDSDTGACYTTGIHVGRGPALDVYLWPERDKDAGASDASDDDDELLEEDPGDAGPSDAGAPDARDGGR